MHNDNITISTFQLFKMFPDNESARVYLEARLWPSGPRCPVCAGIDRITTRKDGYYRCNKCAEDFTVRTGTVMERSHVPRTSGGCGEGCGEVELRDGALSVRQRFVAKPSTRDRVC